MQFKASGLYQAITTGDVEFARRLLRTEYAAVETLNVRDEKTGDTFLHLVVDNAQYFCAASSVSIVYEMACKGMDIDSVDVRGNTCLHKVVRVPGTYRLMVALIRCGVDVGIKNNEEKTAEDILSQDKPAGCEDLLHWYRKFKPGLWLAVTDPYPNARLVQKLLRSWCRVTVKKTGKMINMKYIAQQNPRHIHILRLLEKYENTIEFALACLAGITSNIRQWMNKKIMTSIDVNTKDVSYQYNYPRYSEVPQPILAAAWETNNYEVVDLLMELKPNTRVLYTNQPDASNPKKPLFFQLICGKPVPSDERIIYRIIGSSDMTARNPDGQTLLYEAIAHDHSESLVKALLHYGTNVMLRDVRGRTARDFAQKLRKSNYIDIIDSHVFEMIQNCDLERIERMVLQDYDHIADVRHHTGTTVPQLMKRVESRQLKSMVANIHTIQNHSRKIFQAIKDGDEARVTQLMTLKYSAARDRCGRTVLHRAILHGRKNLVLHLAKEYPQLVNAGDSVERTPLHYAYLLMKNNEVLTSLKSQGASDTKEDVHGNTPEDYKNCPCSTTISCMQKSIREFDLEVFLEETDFELSFFPAIRNGDALMVKELVTGLEEYGGVSRYSSRALFECIDCGQQEIAKYLIIRGFRTNIYKQYVPCIPDDPLCSMMECGHTVTSFMERLVDTNSKETIQLLEDVNSGKVHTVKKYPEPSIYCP